MRRGISELEGQVFDVAVVGGGINGASALQQLTAAGYRTLLVEKNDFGSGSSSRSSRLQHCGLRYLDRGETLWNFLKRPDELWQSCGYARRAMKARSQMLRTAPERFRGFTFFVPVFRGDPYRPWQVAAALKLLRAISPGEAPIEGRRHDLAEAARHPLLALLRDRDRLEGVFSFKEYRYEWPERVVMDALVDAERMGAALRNHTGLENLEPRPGGGWRLSLRDMLDPEASATVEARMVVNAAGIWVDRVAGLADKPVEPKIAGTKGVHIMVKLPPECRDFGVATFHREGYPFYCVPWRGMHYFGPTETHPSDSDLGDLDSIRPLEDEVEWLLAEADHLLPGAGLTRADIRFSWAGIRPHYVEPNPKRKQYLLPKIYDLATEGLPGVLALTSGPLLLHRWSGAAVTRALAKSLAPSGPPQDLSYQARLFPENQNSPPLLSHDGTVKLADLRHAAEHEQPATLQDLLIRRAGVGWSQTMGWEAARKAAETVADIMGWAPADIDREVAAYHAWLEDMNRIAPQIKAGAAETPPETQRR